MHLKEQKQKMVTQLIIQSLGNPNQFLGQRHDLTPKKMSEIAKKFMDKGATILGGCCETRPAHIQELSNLKR